MVENFKTFDNYKVFTTEIAGRPFVVKTGKIAGLANGAALCQYGETTVLCTATASAAPRDGIDFLPLSVDYDEKLYSVGKIPGGFLKREGKPSENVHGACKVDRQQKDQNDHDHQRTKRVHTEFDLVGSLVVNVKRQGLEIGRADKMADHKIVQRQGEAHHQSRKHARQNTG